MKNSYKVKNKFIMLVGLPGSGKTFLANQFLKEESMKTDKENICLDENAGASEALAETVVIQENAATPETVWISSDKIREELYGSEDTQGDSSKVFELMRTRTQDALNEGKNVIYDACNINSKKRTAFLNLLKKFQGEKICVISATPYEECVKRNAQRDRVVPEEVIKRMYTTWMTPYYFEGWDSIYIQYADGARDSYGTPEEFVAKLMDYPHDNPHHTETVGLHMQMAHDYLLNHYDVKKEDNLAVAALLHDCGKPFTKAFCNKRGEPTEIAHYYQHQCNGAYDAMFFQYDGKSEKDILEISMLINLHMIPFDWKEKKAEEKKQKLWGEEVYQKIRMIHEADKASSIAE